MRRPRNYCTVCGEDFASVALFDSHRTGKHAYTFSQGLRFDPPVEDGRRCLAVDEMRERGWELDARGLWVDPAAVEATRASFRKARCDVHGAPLTRRKRPARVPATHRRVKAA